LSAFVFSPLMLAQGQNTSSPASNQSFAPGTDPQASSLALQAIAALQGKSVIHDITLTGNATWGTGDGQTGTVTLRAFGSTESRIDLALPDGTRTEIRDASAGYAQGQWTNPDGTAGMFASHNMMTDAVWFFPALMSLAPNPNTILTYVGLENLDDHSVQHIRSYVATSDSSSGTSNQQLSTMDFYLDPSGLVPYAVIFNQHPDGNRLVNIPIKVVFSNYQAIAGVLVPMHIQRFMNNASILDITLSSAQFNTGLATADFAVAGGAQ
jgi:hypothetical protein